MPLQATSGAASYDAFGGGAAAVPNFIEDVFSTYLYTGNDTSQIINNGIDLAGKGGLVWIKARTAAYSHILSDTIRGTGKFLSSNTTDAQGTDAQDVTAFNTTGFTVGNNARINNPAFNYCSWTFRKQPKFFDVVTYTGNGTAGRTVAHNLGSVPGVIIVKRINAADPWRVYHRSLGNTQHINLDTAEAASTGSPYWNSTTPTSTVFSLGSNADVNGSGSTYVAYLFAHDAGGFGLTGTDNVISCGSFTTDGAGAATVSLGYEPQWFLFKRSDSTSNWRILDVMRGGSLTESSPLIPNLSSAESSFGSFWSPTATGFNIINQAASSTWIYIAIRRGPMKVPTDATKVFAPTATAVTTGTKVTTGFVTDLQMANYRSGAASNTVFTDRLRGISNTSAASPTLGSANTNAEITTIDYLYAADNTGWRQGSFSSGGDSIRYDLRRAPGFFDEVCYTGTGSARTVSHNLAAVPEMAIFKNRTSVAGARNWIVCNKDLGGTNKYLYLNLDAAVLTAPNIWDTPTASVFSLSTYAEYNENTYPIVAYLFATCAGVSKVGSYTGTAAAQTINCGFTAGARFVLIKRTDSTGDWYVWDSARGMVSGTDPSLLLNSTAAEVNANSVYAISTGFQIVSTAAGINASGGSYIFLSVA